MGLNNLFFPFLCKFPRMHSIMLANFFNELLKFKSKHRAWLTGTTAIRATLSVTNCNWTTENQVSSGICVEKTTLQSSKTSEIRQRA